MKLEEEFTEIVCEVNLEQIPNMRIDHGKKLLYVRFLRVIYRMAKITLHSYDLYTTTLKDVGLEINTYRNFVANKMKNVNQCTVLWFVKYNKISHINDNINTNIVDIIKKKF